LKPREVKAYEEQQTASLAADPIIQYMSSDQLMRTIEATKKAMKKAARDLDFMDAARLRDELAGLEKVMTQKK
jgi:excinuclease ABC subunit B